MTDHIHGWNHITMPLESLRDVYRIHPHPDTQIQTNHTIFSPMLPSIIEVQQSADTHPNQTV